MLAALRSELVRLRRPGVLLGWFGLTAVFAALVGFVMPDVVASAASGSVPDGPGVAFPTVAELTASEGLVAGLAAGSSFFGVVALASWAVLTASDQQTGFERLLVSAEPRRGRLLAGKVAALVGCTAVATTVAMMVSLAVGPVGAEAAGVDVDAWRDAGVDTVLVAWLDLFAALVAWGTIGLVVATVACSAPAAIAGGVSYVLIVEDVIGSVASGVSRRLPGNVLEALADGGTEAVAHGAAFSLGVVYVAVGLGAAWWVGARRDITG